MQENLENYNLDGNDCFLLQQSRGTKRPTKLLGWKMGKKCGIIQNKVILIKSYDELFYVTESEVWVGLGRWAWFRV